MTRSDDSAFHKAMDKNPKAVYVVETYIMWELRSTAIFSTKKKAQDWCDQQDGDASCIVCPFIIDEPDFGNRKAS